MARSVLVTCLMLALAGSRVFGGSSPADDTEQPNAIFDYKTWDCTIDGHKFKLTVKNRLTINNRRGDDYRDLGIWESEFVKLVGVTARVLDVDGSEVYRREKGDFDKSCGFGEISLYSSDCLYQTTLESPRYPYTIEFEYTLEARSLFFWNGVDIQSHIPVTSFSYHLTAPRDFRFNSKEYGLELEPEITEVGDKVEYLWSARDIPALEDVDYVPPGYNEGASIAFAVDHFKLDDYALDHCDWKEIGLWYNRLSADRYLNESAGLATPTEQAARSLYSEVKKKTRYVAVSVGLSGWQPHSAAFTQERGYGDCKDMSTLLVSKLRSRGIEAYPCLVLTKDKGLTDPAFPGFEFNHVITMAKVDGDTVWLDCTVDECPYGDVPRLVENVDALVITPAGGELRRIAASAPEDNFQMKDVRIHVGSDRSMAVEASMKITGNYAASARSSLNAYNLDETRRYVNALFNGAEKKYRIQSYDIRNLDELDEPLVISIVAEGIKPLRKIGRILYCDPFLLDEMSGYERADLDERTFPLNTYYPDLDKDRIVVTWDSSVAADSIATPDNDSLVFPFGELRLHSTRYADSVVVEFTKTYRGYQINPDQFDDYEKFRSLNKDIIGRYVKMMNL